MTETLRTTVGAARRERIKAAAGYVSLVPLAEDGPPLKIALDFHFETNVRKPTTFFRESNSIPT